MNDQNKARGSQPGGKRRLADLPGRADEGHRRLAVPLVGTARDAGVRDVRMLDQQRFELGRRYLEAVHLDQLLEPVDDGDRAGGVDAAEVAGV